MTEGSPTQKRKRRPPTPVRKLAVCDDDLNSSKNNIEEHSQEDDNSCLGSQKEAPLPDFNIQKNNHQSQSDCTMQNDGSSNMPHHHHRQH